MDCDKTNIGSAKSIINNGGILENEVYIGNELVQRYWISLNKRYANRHVTGKSQNILYKINSVASNEFTGDICYYHFKEIINKITIPNGKCIWTMDTNGLNFMIIIQNKINSYIWWK